MPALWNPRWPPGADWGKDFPRAGLLTFERQGCPMFEAGVDKDARPLADAMGLADNGYRWKDPAVYWLACNRSNLKLGVYFRTESEAARSTNRG